MFSSLSESGFIPTENYKKEFEIQCLSSHLFQRVASFLPDSQVVQISVSLDSSHLFQRVASFLQYVGCSCCSGWGTSSHLFQRVASFLL